MKKRLNFSIPQSLYDIIHAIAKENYTTFSATLIKLLKIALKIYSMQKKGKIVFIDEDGVERILVLL